MSFFRNIYNSLFDKKSSDTTPPPLPAQKSEEEVKQIMLDNINRMFERIEESERFSCICLLTDPPQYEYYDRGELCSYKEWIKRKKESKERLKKK